MSPIRIIRRNAPTPAPAAPPATVPAAAGCERCRDYAEVQRLAQERFLEIRQLQRENAELLGRVRPPEGAEAAARPPGAGPARLRRLLDGPSIAELPVEGVR